MQGTCPVSSEREPTPTQAGIMDESNLELVGWEEKAVIAQAGDGSRVRIGPAGKVEEIGSDPRPSSEEAKEEPVTESGGAEGGNMAEVVETETLPAPRAEGEPDADPREFLPPGAELAYDPGEPSDAWRAIDKHREVEILEELAGNALETMLYSFQQDGSMVTDLSVGGVNECIRVFNERGGARIGIAEEPPTIQETDKAWRVMVRAVDFRTGVSRWGIFEQPKVIKLRNNRGEKENPFSLTVALNKAERNALAKFIPEQIRRQLIAQMLQSSGRGKEATEAVRQLKAIGSFATEIKPPLEDEEASALLAEIRAEYDAIKKVSRLALPPAAFNQFVTAAQHSHTRLRECLAHMKQIREEVEAKAAADA